MPTLPAILKQRLSRARRVAVLGIGSPLRGDDAAGVLAARDIAEKLKRASKPRLKVFIGETAPENLTGPIKEYSPTHLIVLDAADTGNRPGHIELIEPDWIGTGASFSTHSLPVHVLIQYLHAHLKCDIILLGIQPASCEFGLPVSRSVQRAIQRVSEMICAACF